MEKNTKKHVYMYVTKSPCYTAVIRQNIVSQLSVQFSSVTQLCPTLLPHGLQHSRLLCPSPNPRACSKSCPSSQRYDPTISSSVIPFSSSVIPFSCFQSLTAFYFFKKVRKIYPQEKMHYYPFNLQSLILLHLW